MQTSPEFPYNELNLEEFKSVLEKTPAFQELPEDAVIVFSFFDGNGKTIEDMYFTLNSISE